MPRQSNFTDAQKAELYVLHRATCVYSGKKLWLLDGGANPYCVIDWADHVNPTSRGGPSSIENGVCASWEDNFNKRNSVEVPNFLFYKGKPTKHFFATYKSLSQRRQKDLKRLSALHHSDWYFNRAIFRLLLGVAYLHNGKGSRARDDLYYAAAAMKAIIKWRRITEREGILTLEQRNLAPRRPSVDQSILLSIRVAKSVAKILSLMKRLLPFYVARIKSEPE